MLLADRFLQILEPRLVALTRRLVGTEIGSQFDEQQSSFEAKVRTSVFHQVEEAIGDGTISLTIPELRDLKDFKIEPAEGGGAMPMRDALKKAYKVASKNAKQVCLADRPYSERRTFTVRLALAARGAQGDDRPSDRRHQ